MLPLWAIRCSTFTTMNALVESRPGVGSSRNKTIGDGDSPALAVGDSSMAFVADHGFRRVSETELIDQCLDSCFLLGGGERPGKPENKPGTKILRTGGRLKINPGIKRGYSYAAVYNCCISQFYAALFLKPLHKKTYL